MQQTPRLRRRQAILAGVLLCGMLLLGLAPALAQPEPQQARFGYSRVSLPLVVRQPDQPLPPVIVQPPRIVAWLDIPGQVRINDRMQIIVNIKNEGPTDFGGRTDVIIPYDGRKFQAVDSSFDQGRGDWVKQNRFPNDLTVEFGPLRSGEFRRGVIYYDLREVRVGDRMRVRARHNNGRPACGQDWCQTNERSVEVTSESTGGGIGTLPPGTVQTQKLGDISYGELRRWVPAGFRPGEQVVTWLNIAGGGQRPLTLQQRADSQGRVFFNIDVTGLRNGFYSIVAHGKDTRTQIVGEFQVINSPVTSPLIAGTRQVLIPLPSPADGPADAATAQADAAPAQAAGSTVLTGVVAAAGTGGATRLQGVQVNVVAADGSVVGAAATDSFGGYVVPGLATGTYSVTFDPHFSFDAVARRFQVATQTDVSVPASGLVGLDAELAAGSTISGLVTGAGVGSLEGVSVVLLSGEEVVEATTTGADGHHMLEGVPSGDYTIQFDPATSPDGSVLAFAGGSLAVAGVVAPTPVSGQSITLSRNPDTGEIAGQVVAANSGAPLNEVFVVFERFDVDRNSFEYAGLAVTDEEGAYSALVTPGTYRAAFLPGYSPDPDSARYLGEYFRDVSLSTPASANTFVLGGGGTRRADAALTPGGTIAGTVSGSDGPLEDVAVLAYNTADGTLAEITATDEDGAYRTAALPAGSYRIEFATFLSSNAETQAYAGATRADPVAVSGTADVSGIDITLSPGGAIAGSVAGTADAPLAGVLVLAIDTAGTPTADDDTVGGLALTGADGAYTMPGLAVGDYAVAFVTELSGDPTTTAYFDEYYDDAATLAEAAPVTVAAGQTTENIDAALAQGGQIRGRVVAGNGGFGLAGILVEVFAVSDPDTLVAFAITDELGEYATTALTPGASYLVRFDPRFGGGRSLYAPEYYDDALDVEDANPVAVASTEPVTGIDATLLLIIR